MKNKLLIGGIIFSSLFAVSCGTQTTTSSSGERTTSSSSSNGEISSFDPSSSSSSSSIELGEKVALNWVVDDKVNVNLDGYNSLPSEGHINQTLVFTLSVIDENYEVSNVYHNDIKVFEYAGSYSITIQEEATIEIIAEKKLKEIKVTKQPNNLTYYVNDNFDPTGLEVTAVYQDDSTEILELNSMAEDGYYFMPIVFVGGEEYVTIHYKNKSVEIKLAAIVELLVSINPNGGKISSAYLDRLAALNLKNYNVDANGVITFNHSNDLPQDIALPTIDEVTKTGYEFISWGVDETVITNNTNKCIRAVASWQLSLVEVTDISLIKEEGVPYLVIDGRFNSVDSVYLYLYEGQAKISVVGDTYTKTDSNEFHVKFDLRNLSNQGSKYVGKWMDIRFNTVIDGKEESMEFDVIENPNINVDLNQKIFTPTHSYYFATYNNKLKVYFQDYGYYYNLDFSSDENHDYVTFTGQICEDFANQTLQISWWVTKEDMFRTTKINADGTFSLKLELDEFPINTNCYAHITILNDNNEILFGGTSTNLLQKACKDSLPAYAPTGSTIKNCVSYTGTKVNRTYYVGGNGTGLMIFSIDN